MSLFPIFKINKLTNKNVIDEIYVFYGDNLVTEETDKLFRNEPRNDIFKNIFDNMELETIIKNKTNVKFIKQSIHIDDSIGVIKLKLAVALSMTSSISEMYLFCLKNERLNPITVYQKLTQNDRLVLTKVRLEQMLLNIYNEDDMTPINFHLENKDKYTFDDILQLNLHERKYNVAKIMGQKMIFTDEYPFIADPFYVTEYDILLERSRNEMSSLNNNLLLETGTIVKNTIYLCLAEDVLKNAEDKDGNNDEVSDYTSKIYFPFLYNNNIFSVKQLQTEQHSLINKTKKQLSENTVRGFENIDLFYDIFTNRQKSKYFYEKNN